MNCPRCVKRRALRTYDGHWCVCGWSWEPDFPADRVWLTGLGREPTERYNPRGKFV